MSFHPCLDLLKLVRCPSDGGSLVLDLPPPADDGHGAVVDAVVRCVLCASEYAIRDGILIMVSASDLGRVSRDEQQERDRGALSDDFAWEDDAQNRSELASTLAALGPVMGQDILELGCGRGRITRHLRGAKSILAVDFSLESLRALSLRPGLDAPMLLVCADVTQFRIVPRSFDRVISTLTSNLPARSHRDAMNRLAGRALKPGGHFVLTAHAYGLREWFRRDPKAGCYPGTRIFRQLFSSRELAEEVESSFGRVVVSRIQVVLPILGRIGLGRLASPRFANTLPGVNSLAALLLVTAREPRQL